MCISTIQKTKLQTPTSTFSLFYFFFHHDISSSLSAQCTLRAGNLALLARNPSSSHANRHSKSLECTLSPVVVVVTAQAVDVQRDASGLSKALQAVRDHLAAKLAQHLALEAKVDNGVGAVGQIDDGARESLVQRGVGVAEAGDASQGAEGFGKGGADGEAAVFGGVVVVNWILENVLLERYEIVITHRERARENETNCEDRPCS